MMTKAKKFIMTSRIVWFVRSIAMLTVSTRIVVIIYIRPTMKPLNPATWTSGPTWTSRKSTMLKWTPCL